MSNVVHLADFSIEYTEEYQSIMRTLRRGDDETEIEHVKRLLAWAYAQYEGDLLAVIGLVDEACERGRDC